VLFVGVLPASLLAVIRRAVIAPDRSEVVQERRRTVRAGHHVASDDREFMRFLPMQLFKEEHRCSTIVALLLGLGSLLVIWATNV
jgi:hypothetical protein